MSRGILATSVAVLAAVLVTAGPVAAHPGGPPLNRGHRAVAPAGPPTERHGRTEATGSAGTVEPAGSFGLLSVPRSVLVYGPTAGGYADTTPGTTVEVWDEARWAAATVAEFGAFDAIVFGDMPGCVADPSVWDTAVANRHVWSNAVTGNVIVHGTDADWHGKDLFVHQSVAFAAADPPGTPAGDPSLDGPGVYASLSCAYHDAPAGTVVELLAGLGPFVVEGVTNCPSRARKVAHHPALAGIDDAYLSDWWCSAHETFTGWPASYETLAVIEDATPGNGPEVTRPYVMARGAASLCDDEDADGDCLADSVELALGTAVDDQDTDGDGLLDPWEVGPAVAGAGIRTASGEVVATSTVLGPYANAAGDQCTRQAGADGRPPVTFRCLNHPPDPRHKDLFLELDWDDGATRHHAPDLDALRDVVAAYAAAPVANPDGTTGIRLSVLVDEAVTGGPVCDQGESAARATWFGTPAQRADAAVLDARSRAVRYVWSGRSSAADGGCTPTAIDAIDDRAAYDASPFGDADVGGRDVLVTLGPSWASLGRLLGEREADATRQLWGRALMHLLGHSIGIADDATVGNDPAPAGRTQAAPGTPLPPLAPEPYGSWAGLQLAPPAGPGTPVAEPAYDPTALGQADPDVDGWAELGDTCPGVWDPDQDDTDADGTGDACDDDLDGDGAASPGWDLWPRDSDDDGVDNDADTDDDADGVADGADGCPLVADPGQADTDGDGTGDACDDDEDGDGTPGAVEARLGAGRLDPAATPEYVGWASSCTNAVDDDGDGHADGADGGCGDADGDTLADVDDNCPGTAAVTAADADADGTGDACELAVRVTYVSRDLLGTADPFTDIGWSANAAGDWSVVIDGVDCSTGLVLDSGSYDPGPAGPAATAVTRIGQFSLMFEGDNVLRLCLTAGGETVSTNAVVGWDLAPPDVPMSLDAATDTGLAGDGVTAAADVAVGGVTEPLSAVTVTRDGSAIGRVLSGPGGEWSVADAGLPEGAHDYVATAVDAAGNATAAGAPFTVVVDRTAPETTIDAGPAEASTSGPDVTFTSASSEPGGGLECRLDAAAFAPCEATTPLTGLADGTHTFSVRATDGAGNVDPTPATRTWTVTATP